MINLNTKCEGWFNLSVFKVDESGKEVQGSRKSPVPPFRNLITDAGLDRMGNNADWLTWCQVGSGSTAPSFGDTALVSRVSASQTIQANQISAQSSEPYYVARTNTYRFSAGLAAGNLSEVGIGWSSTGSLFSRALILDALGSPTTITVLSDEILDVTYQFRQYMPTVDGVDTLFLRGQSYQVQSRALAVTTASDSGWSIGVSGTSAATSGTGILNSAFTGGVGTITASSPQGTPLPSSSITPSNYSTGSLQREAVIFFNNSSGNNPAGIGSIRAKLGIGLYQFGFTPNIMKTAEDTLSLTLRHSWARKSI